MIGRIVKGYLKWCLIVVAVADLWIYPSMASAPTICVGETNLMIQTFGCAGFAGIIKTVFVDVVLMMFLIALPFNLYASNNKR
jgi:hypothetical protein